VGFEECVCDKRVGDYDCRAATQEDGEDGPVNCVPVLKLRRGFCCRRERMLPINGAERVQEGGGARCGYQREG
jgi:hypothetical protein